MDRLRAIAPTLEDFFRLRFAPANHVLQSATRALKTGMSEEIVLACLLHDTVNNLIKPDHGWWGAQLYEPYLPEKSTFAIRYHQTLRFFPDEQAGYEYPESYFRTFGPIPPAPRADSISYGPRREPGAKAKRVDYTGDAVARVDREALR